MTAPKNPTSQPATPQTSPAAFSAARLTEARAGVAEQNRLAGEVLAWLESLPRTLPDHPKELPYDSLAVYHAVKFLGETRYAPAAPFLVRETFENKLWIANPDVKLVVDADIPLELESPVFGALIQIGAPSAAPLVDEYLQSWKLPRGQKRDNYLIVIKYALEEDAIVGAALQYIHKRLVKANFIPIDRDELDALQHLKRELLKPFE